MKILDYWMKYKEDELARHQIDRLLKMQAKICVNLGIDSTKDELSEAKKKIAVMDRMIYKIDRQFFPSRESLK